MCDGRLFAAQIAAIDLDYSVGDLSQADNFPDMARDVLAAAPPSFAIVGLSMGGILAFEMLRQAPERVTHLALIDTTPYPDTPEKQNLRLEQIRIASAGGLRELAIDSLKPVYLAKANQDDDALLDTILDMAVDLGPDVFARQSLALKDRADSVPTLATIDCPTAIICGDEDRLCAPAVHEFMAGRIDNSRLAILPGCGHLATMESPAAVNQQLQQMLATQ